MPNSIMGELATVLALLYMLRPPTGKAEDSQRRLPGEDKTESDKKKTILAYTL